MITRLSHLITEIRNFPIELREQEEYGQVVGDYMQTYSEVHPPHTIHLTAVQPDPLQALSFEKRKSTPGNILEAVEMLKGSKQRHSEVVPNMARACRAMRKKYQLGMEEVGPNHSLTRAIQYCLDRLYLHR